MMKLIFLIMALHYRIYMLLLEEDHHPLEEDHHPLEEDHHPLEEHLLEEDHRPLEEVLLEESLVEEALV
jgi:hypothetical protein